MGGELVPPRRVHLRPAHVLPGEPPERPVRAPRRAVRHRDRPRVARLGVRERDFDRLVRGGAVPRPLPERRHDGHVDPLCTHPRDAARPRVPMVRRPGADPRVVRCARVPLLRGVRPRPRLHRHPGLPVDARHPEHADLRRRRPRSRRLGESDPRECVLHRRRVLRPDEGRHHDRRGSIARDVPDDPVVRIVHVWHEWCRGLLHALANSAATRPRVQPRRDLGRRRHLHGDHGRPKATDYYPAAWRWFAIQDANVPPELRPAFLSWWDYGFEAVDRGVHPTVADNFQDGYQVSGQFITAQNESAGIAILAVRLLDADFRLNHQNFRPAVTAALQAAGLPVAAIRAALLRPADYISIVLADPVTFGLWTPDLQTANALYIFLTNLLTHRLSEDRIVSLYHDVRDATG